MANFRKTFYSYEGIETVEDIDDSFFDGIDREFADVIVLDFPTQMRVFNENQAMQAYVLENGGWVRKI